MDLQENPLMQIATQTATISKPRLWTARVLTTLTVLFMLFDVTGHFLKPAPVVEAFARLGVPINLSETLAILLLVCTILYAIPRTAVLGAILITGYLGGAVSIHMRAGSSRFETVFPILLGIVAWAGIYLREDRLHGLLPLRT